MPASSRRKTRRLQAAGWRQADRCGNRDRIGHLGVRHLCVRVARARRQGQLGRGRRAEHDVSRRSQTKQFDAIMAPPSWIVEAEAKGFGKTIYDTAEPGVFDKDFGGTLPVLVDLHAAGHGRSGQGERAGFRERHLPRHALGENGAARRSLCIGRGQIFRTAQIRSPSRPNSASTRSTWAYDGRIDKASFERGGKALVSQGHGYSADEISRTSSI